MIALADTLVWLFAGSVAAYALHATLAPNIGRIFAAFRRQPQPLFMENAK